MKNLKKLCCIIAAAAMLVFCLPIHADADALLIEGSWYINKQLQINSHDVYGYDDAYILGNGEKEAVCAFRRGDVVYVKQAVERMGITWGRCTSCSNQYDPEYEFYGWTDMRYLSEVGTAYEEAPVKTEIVTELVTVLPDVPDTQPVTTKATTAKAATTSAVIKTSAVTMKVTSSETTKKTAQAVLSEEDSGSDSGSFFRDNLTLILTICVLILVVSSIILAAGIINYNKKKKAKHSDAQYMPDQTPDQTPRRTPDQTPPQTAHENAPASNQTDTKYCTKCGAKNPARAVFCSKCGGSFYSVNGKNQ